MRVGVFYFNPDYGIDIGELAAEYRAAGIDEALLEVPDVGRDEILRLLDRYAPLAAA